MRDVTYFFPLAVPLILGAIDVAIVYAASHTALGMELAREFFVAMVFACLTVDVWGITDSVASQRDNNAALGWVLLLLTHLLLYVFGVMYQSSSSSLAQAGQDTLGEDLKLIAILVLSLLLLFIGRECAWRRQEAVPSSSSSS